MSVQTISRPITYDDLAGLPDDGKRYELIDGVVDVAAPPQDPHQYALLELATTLNPHVKAGRLGRLWIAPFDVHLSPLNGVQPDLLFVRRDRLHIAERRYVAGPPDLVVEILSPGSYNRDKVVKAQLYARFRVPEYWQVDTNARTVRVFALKDGRYEAVPRGDDGRPWSLVLSDLIVDEAGLFLDRE